MDKRNKFFYSNACHVCKAYGKKVRLINCVGCQMISYCGLQHQMEHEPDHKIICKVIQNVRKTRCNDNTDVLKPEKYMKNILELMYEVHAEMNNLESDEMMMIAYPKACIVCFRTNLDNPLVACENCPCASFCTRHLSHREAEHQIHCNQFKLCYEVDQMSAELRTIYLNMDYLQHLNGDMLPQNMKDFLAHYAFPNYYSNIKKIILLKEVMQWCNVHSEYISWPLSTYFAIHILDFTPHCQSMVIHIIGMSQVDVESIHTWEILLHLIPNLMELQIVMIGLELTMYTQKEYSRVICRQCVTQNKKFVLETATLYRDYISVKDSKKPNLIIGHNLRMFSYMQNYTLTELELMKTFVEQNCPFVITCDTKDELAFEKNRIKSLLYADIPHLYYGKNRFSSMQPRRGPLLRIFYEHAYIVIYESFRKE